MEGLEEQWLEGVLNKQWDVDDVTTNAIAIDGFEVDNVE